ncbi:MAG: hypothetical protein J1E38_04005 [Paramuribaculum sp.]|nr:hypothetical protein [Paramuribaculum sp.]
MKKIITLTLVLCALFMCGAPVQAQKTRAKAKTSQTAKKRSSKVTVAEFKEDGGDIFKFYNNGKYDAKNGSSTFDTGYYVADNGAVIYASENFGRSWAVFGDTIYDLDGLQKDGATDWNLLPNIINSNGDKLDKIMKKGVINFNSDTQTVTYSFDGKSGKFALSDIPADSRSPLTWVKKP